ncbi:MAG: hypothetical protein ACO1NM_10310 [Sphingobium phenoxybenzoativorans]
MRRYIILAFVMLCAAPAAAKQVTPISPITFDASQGVRVTGMDLVFAAAFRAEQAESDAKAAHKRAAAGLPPLDADSYPTGPAVQEQYATLPFKQMFPLVMRDVTREWGLAQGRPVKLRITLDTLKTADAAVAILIAASYDRLAGMVEIFDAGTNQPLGSFRIDVVNAHGGWGGMLIRGGGIREKLAEEFGLELSRQISGRRKKPKA